MEHVVPTEPVKEVAQVPASEAPRPGLLVGNLGEPIKLTGVNMCGVSAEAARGGDTIEFWTRLSLTSDDPIFHRIVENLGSLIAGYAKGAGRPILPNRAETILLVIKPDNTAELWVDTAAVSLGFRPKRSMVAGSVVFERDIADVTEMRFPLVDIGSKDRIVCIFRQDWRFALFFDFNPKGDLSLDDAAKALGTLYRNLKYRHVYDALADEAVFPTANSRWLVSVCRDHRKRVQESRRRMRGRL